MARSFVGSNKGKTSDVRAKKHVQIRSNSNLMTSSMPSSILTKNLYSNVSTSNQKNANSIGTGKQNITNKRSQISKRQDNGVKKVPNSSRDNQVS